MGKQHIEGSQVLNILCFCCFFMAILLGYCRGGQLLSEEDSTAPMETRERHALYSAIQGFVGKLWNGSDLYPDPCGWTPIQGVSCDFYNGSWYASTMNIGSLYDNSLRCTESAKFTRHLFDLHHLTTLSFFSCFISPTIISNLNWEKLSRSLQHLEFRSNPGLIGNFPAALGTLTELRSLVIIENGGLRGELPVEIGNLINLKRLVLSGNGFAGQIPTSLGGLTQLLILDLSSNNLSESIPLTFGGLTSLLKLDLSKNNIEGSLPLEFGNLKNLTLMDIGSNNLSGGLAGSVQQMVSLQEMVISNNPSLGGDLMRIQWKNLQNLEELDLTNTGLKGQIPESISELKGLRFLGLSQNRLTGTPPMKLSSMHSLTALYLNGNNLSGDLGFPEMFYVRMKRRFGAWNNTNLCSRSGSYVPIGVRGCPLGNFRVHMGSLSSLSAENLNRTVGLEVSEGWRQRRSSTNRFCCCVLMLFVLTNLMNMS